MKKKINRYLLLTVFLSLSTTLLMAIAVFHHMYREQIIEDMKTYGEVLSGMISSGEELRDHYRSPDSDIRITAISAGGDVVDDSQAGNHADRPEVKEAEEAGEGYAVRHSDTLNRDMYYYAVQLENGDVLRLSKEEKNIWSVFESTLRPIIAIGIGMFLLCMLLSRYITNSLVRPIEKLASDIDNVDGIQTYEELVPFITTIQKQHEDILKSAKMRQEFTANVSHELKTPLTSISGFAEIMKNGMVPPADMGKFAEKIYNEAQRLIALVQDIIKLSKLDEKDTSLCEEEVELDALVQEACERLQPAAERKRVTLSAETEPILFRGVKQVLSEMIYNLCDNAIRYNKEGGAVFVTLKQKADRISLTVRDTGIGIAKEEQGRIFERFYRVDASRSAENGGTGLGLSIVKHGAALHNGKIFIESEIGNGTSIEISMPYSIN